MRAATMPFCAAKQSAVDFSIYILTPVLARDAFHAIESAAQKKITDGETFQQAHSAPVFVFTPFSSDARIYEYAFRASGFITVLFSLLS